MDYAEYTVSGLHQFLAATVTSFRRDTPVLDLGCGSGAWLNRLHDIGFNDLTGADMNPPNLSFAKVMRANLDTGPLAIEKRFGLITSIEVIEHLENVGALLATIANGLDPQGRAIVTTPNIHSLRSRVRFMLTGKLPSFDEKGEPTHIAPIWLPALRKIAARYGLEITDACTYPERDTLTFGKPVRAVAAIARLVAPDDLPGDSLCIELRPVRQQ